MATTLLSCTWRRRNPLLLALFSSLLLLLTVATAHAGVTYDFPLDPNPGWSAGSGWEWGSMVDGYATAAHTGTNWYSFVKNSTPAPADQGNYSNNMPASYLTTGRLNFAGVSGVHLTFWRCLGLANAFTTGSGDRAAVEISTDGGENWQVVWETTASVADAEWVYCDYDISSVADNQPAVWVRWAMGPTDFECVCWGWNLDDVQFTGSGAPVTGTTFSLDTNPGWAVTGGWAYGMPLGGSDDPSFACTGTNVYGYDLSGPYSASMGAEYLTASALDCSAYDHVYATFWRWLNVEGSYWDTAAFLVSSNGTDWTPVWTNPAFDAVHDTAWRLCSYDLTALAAGQPTVYLRWQMGPTDTSAQYGGWNLDDIALLGWSDVAAPVADFSADATLGLAPLPVQFTDASANAPTSWSWDFGDGDTATTQSPSHTYLLPGCYDVSLTAENSGGSDTETKTAYVTVGFWDTPTGSFGFLQEIACYQVGIVTGYKDGSYQPKLQVNRGQMAVYIARALAPESERPDLPSYVPPETPTFSDVATDFWAYAHIEYAAEQNVVKGYLDGTYHPEIIVNRGQMAIYVARSIADPTQRPDLPDYTPASSHFSDVATGAGVYKFVEYCYEHGVVTGYLDGTYHPEYAVNRDQMAVYIARAFGLL